MKLKEKKQPLISVVMPVYNAGDFLVDSIKSILNQTYKNFEFIIVNDDSTDNSFEIIKAFAKKDKRIKFLKNKTNLGVSKTVNKAILKAKGDYIARMDADDIAMKNRLSLQLNFLQKNKNTVALGGQCILIDKNNLIIGNKKFPTKFSDIYKYIFKFVPVQQPTLMIAKKRLPKNFEFYTDGMNTAEEIELYFKFFQFGKVENLKQNLLMYRIHDNNTSFKDLKKTFLLTLLSRIKAIVSYGYKPSIKDFIINLIQTFCVLILPKKVTLWLYAKIRKVPINPKKPYEFYKKEYLGNFNLRTRYSYSYN